LRILHNSKFSRHTKVFCRELYIVSNNKNNQEIPMDNLRRRFFMAVTHCTGESAVKPRLAYAWIEHLDAIDTEQLPVTIQKEFESLRTAMYKDIPMSGEHIARASVRKMSQKQAAEHTRRIAEISREILTQQFAETISEAEARVNPASDASYTRQTDTMLN
jgi:hypothetical protein